MAPFRPECLLVTGGAGFIGSNFVSWVLQHDPQVVVVNLGGQPLELGNQAGVLDVEGDRPRGERVVPSEEQHDGGPGEIKD